ncbi:hypothetical protein E8E11_008809 [Didymella keratinophila]|nr:hypothetical protein E8E11_008809 [Didymella keratinophila]
MLDDFAKTDGKSSPFERVIFSGRAEELFTLVERYQNLGLPKEASNLILACLPDVSSSESETWETWMAWAEFLSHLATPVSEINAPELTDTMRPFFMVVLKNVLGHFEPAISGS